ncbi:MAG: DUF3969 family protein [Erysipelotrichaceae bacterium]|nr:DUF3969 family protein [Erysipelotrichaceae bacterium]
MVIPKSFSDGHDFETMILTSILGTFTALKEDLISFKQAESYWLSDLTAEIFEELSLSKEIVEIIQKGIQLKDYSDYPEVYDRKLDELIVCAKELISRYYTEYDDTNAGIIN